MLITIENKDNCIVDLEVLTQKKKTPLKKKPYVNTIDKILCGFANYSCFSRNKLKP